MPNFSFWKRDIMKEDRPIGSSFFVNTYRKGIAAAKKELLSRDDVNILRVSRSRRGQWGEWYEIWYHRGDGKVRLERQGWM